MPVRTLRVLVGVLLTSHSTCALLGATPRGPPRPAAAITAVAHGLRVQHAIQLSAAELEPSDGGHGRGAQHSAADTKRSRPVPTSMVGVPLGVASSVWQCSLRVPLQV